MADDQKDDNHEYGGRREADRRQSEVPIDFADRRKGERRSGKDRRASPRVIAH